MEPGLSGAGVRLRPKGGRPTVDDPSMTSRRLEAFLRGENSAPWTEVLRLPLIPPAILYGAAAWIARAARTAGLLPRTALPVPVVSVGNLVAGGTGKTPLVRTVCRILMELGHRPMVLGRGYGAPVDGTGLDEEGASLARDLPEVRIVQGADKARAAAAALGAEPGPTVIVLDDGAQSHGLARDLEILVLDARRPFGSGWPFPAGMLREFRGGVRRADVVVLSHAGEAGPDAVDRLRRMLVRCAPNALVAEARHRPARLLPSGEDPASLRGARVQLVSAIAHPASFEQTVAALGAVVTGHDAFRDHHRFIASDLARAAERARAGGAGVILATGKDEPKLRRLPPPPLPLAFLEIELDFDSAGEAALVAALRRAAGAPRT